jgi:hypothetical protein
MAEKDKPGAGRITESDVYKSFTHPRPDPKTPPPTGRPRPDTGKPSDQGKPKDR